MAAPGGLQEPWGEDPDDWKKKAFGDDVFKQRWYWLMMMINNALAKGDPDTQAVARSYLKLMNLVETELPSEDDHGQ